MYLNTVAFDLKNKNLQDKDLINLNSNLDLTGIIVINNELMLLQKYFVLACRTIAIYRKIAN